MVLPLETIELSKIHYTSCNYLNIKHTSVLQQCKISNGLSAASTRSHYFFSSICCFRVPAERWVEINHQCLKSRGNCALAHRDASRQLFKWDSLLLHPQRKKKKLITVHLILSVELCIVKQFGSHFILSSLSCIKYSNVYWKHNKINTC